MLEATLIMKRLLSFFAGFLFLLRAGAQPATGIHVMAYSANAASLATSPATTQASGSTILVWIGNGALSLLSGFPTDNKGNKYVSLGSHSYAPDWPSSGEALYVCTNAVGGSGHIFDWSNGTAVESTMMVVEVKNGGAIHNVQWNEVTTVSGSQTSLYATNSAPASIVAVWVGDAGATTSSATPNNSFAVLNAQTLASGYVEGVTASKDLSAAGTNNVTWTCSPGQGAHMWMVAVQASQTGIAAPSLNWSNPSDIVYGTPLGSSQLNATATFNSTNVSGTFTYAPPGGTILNAGRAQTLSVTFTPTDTSALRAVSQNVTINVDPLAVVLAGSRNYDGTTAAAAAILSVANVVGGDVVTVASGSGTLAGAGLGPQALTGSGTLALGGAAAANYTLSGASGTVTIHAAPLTITATAQAKAYGAALSLGTTAFSVGSGLAAGQTVTGVSLTANGGTAATAPVGSYVITPNGATGAGGFLAGNYNITYSTATLTVNKAILTVTANNAIRVYGQANPAFGANYAGFCNGETLATSGVTGNPSLTTTATATSPVPGPYPITAAIGTLAAANYSFGFVGGELLINKANTVAAINSSTNPALPGASVTFTFTAGAVAPGAGTPTGAVNFSIDGFIAGYAALSGGSAVFVTNSLDHGSNTVIGEYAGDANFIGSTNILSPAQVIDTPPVAGPVTIYRGPAGGAQVTIADLLTNVSDADGDAITFVGVSAASAHGGTVGTNSGWVLYMPAPGFTNADTFTYLVTDGLSAPVTGTVTVDVAIDTGVSRNLAITNLDNGSVAIAGQGIPGSTYIVQYTADPPPTTNWLTLATVTADSSGAFVLFDSTASALRLYRAIYP